MHAHDRTLLAKLGFADPDKQDPRHDLACQYLAGRPGSLMSRLWVDRHYSDPEAGVPRLEVPITKGEGQYRTTIGFIDLLVPVIATRDVFRQSHNLNTGRYEVIKEGTERDRVGSIAVEVKVRKLGAGDMLRQVALYREYKESPVWAIATVFRLTRPELDSLESNGIRHVFLGRGFEEWIEKESRRQEEDPPAMVEI